MIFYFIYSGKFNSKVGGHFQSIKTIAKSISQEKEVQVIVLGHSLVDIYSDVGLKTYFFKVSFFNFPFVIITLLKHIKKFPPTNLHAFDSFAYYIVRILSFLTKTPSYLTKCGGPNFKHLAVSQNTIFFSKENVDFYNKLKKFKDVNKYLIPNRVLPPKPNKKRLEKIDIDPNFNGIKFLRINRIGVYYKKTMLDSLQLVNYLNEIGIKSRLYIIGFVTEEEVLNELSKKENIVFLTKKKYYLNASELIPLFDCVIGTGRSAMEAFSFGKIVLSPISNGSLPVLVERQNINYFLENNFSERVFLNKFSPENYKTYLCSFDWKYNIQNNDSILLFDEFFNVNTKQKEYIHIYATKVKRKFFIFDFLYQSIMFFSKLILDLLRSLFPKYEALFAKKVMKLITNTKS